MAENTRIQWATHTFNPWRGCQKVAAGCANCYAETQSRRNPGTLGIWGPDGTRVVASESMWRQPLKWNLQASDRQAYHSAYLSTDSERPRVFCASLADWAEDWKGPVVDSRGRRLELCRRSIMAEEFCYEGEHAAGCVATHRAATLNDVRARLFRLIDDTPHLDWLLLTKRPDNIRRMVPAYFPGGYIAEAGRMNQEGPRPNLWLGTSVACQEDADRNLQHLAACRDIADKLFVSVEPLVGPVDFSRLPGGGDWEVDALNGYWTTCQQVGPDEFEQGQCEQGPAIDWVIVGGESGPNARPCDVKWIDALVRQCRTSGVPVFVKQLGARPIMPCEGDWDAIQSQWPSHVLFDFPEDGEHKPIEVLLRDHKGGDPSEWPESLRVREVPS